MAKTHLHKQTVPSDVWLINHNFGSNPTLDVAIDHDGVQQKILGEVVTQLDDNTIEIRFTNPHTGTVRTSSLGRVPATIFDVQTIIVGASYPNNACVLLDTTTDYQNGLLLPLTSQSVEISAQTGRIYNAISTEIVTQASLSDNTIITSSTGLGLSGTVTGITTWDTVIYVCTSDGTLYQFDTDNHAMLGTTSFAKSYSGITTDGTYLYIGTGADDTVDRHQLDMSFVDSMDVAAVGGDIVAVAYDHDTSYLYVGSSTSILVYTGYSGTQVGGAITHSFGNVDDITIYGGMLFLTNESIVKATSQAVDNTRCDVVVLADLNSIGDNRVILDKATDLRWLSFLETEPDSVSSAGVRLSGDLTGWRFPTKAEILAFMYNVMPTLNSTSIPVGNTITGISNASQLGIEAAYFKSIMGTIASEFSYGMYTEPTLTPPTNVQLTGVEGVSVYLLVLPENTAGALVQTQVYSRSGIWLVADDDSVEL